MYFMNIVKLQKVWSLAFLLFEMFDSSHNNDNYVFIFNKLVLQLRRLSFN